MSDLVVVVGHHHEVLGPQPGQHVVEVVAVGQRRGRDDRCRQRRVMILESCPGDRLPGDGPVEVGDGGVGRDPDQHAIGPCQVAQGHPDLALGGFGPGDRGVHGVVDRRRALGRDRLGRDGHQRDVVVEGHAVEVRVGGEAVVVQVRLDVPHDEGAAGARLP